MSKHDYNFLAMFLLFIIAAVIVCAAGVFAGVMLFK